MGNSLETYDPKNIEVIVAGSIITGFADDIVSVERNANVFEDEAGAQGDVVRYAMNDKRGTITIKLLQTSKSNLFLSGLSKADELSGLGVFPVVVKDTRGKDIHVAAQAWIQKIAPASYKRGVETREWEIRTNNLQTVVGGAA